jgi:hypothetical protein
VASNLAPKGACSSSHPRLCREPAAASSGPIRLGARVGCPTRAGSSEQRSGVMLEVHGPAPRSRRWAQGMNVRVGEGSVPAECSQLVLEPAVRYPLGPPSMSEGSMRPWGCAHLRRPGGRRPAAAGRASPGGQPGVARQQAASKATSVRSPLRRGRELWSGARSSPASLEPTGHRRSDDRHAAASAGLVPHRCLVVLHVQARGRIHSCRKNLFRSV